MVAAIAGAAPGAANASSTVTSSAGVGVVPTEVCDRESYVWSGSAMLSPDEAIDTGVLVPAILGSTLRVVGTSADGLDATGIATALTVSVGGVAAVAGAVVDGGHVVVHGTTAPVSVNGATVVVDRCSLVAVAPPPELPSGSLPETGTGDPAGVAILAAASLVVGLIFMRTSRRTPTAGGRAPGSPPAAARPAPD